MAGGIYHVYARGNDRQAIFSDDFDRRTYLRLLADAVSRQRWSVLAYCLMTNHVHLVVETPEPDLGVGMHRLHGPYARRFNLRHRRTGHLFERRYGSKRVEDDAQLWMTLGYVLRNPVDAGLCARAAEWEWSSHAAALEVTTAPCLDAERLMAYMGALGPDALRTYAACVEPEAAETPVVV
jgi:REP element-mobilizing transposase RayT